MTTAQQVIDKARECLGTPFVHQGRLKGVGLDCVGLLMFIGTELGLATGIEYSDYRRNPDGTIMEQLMDLHLERKREGEPVETADVVLIKYRNPQHAALVTTVNEIGEFTAIHATERGVVEHRFDLKWTRRIVAVYRIPGVTNG